MADIKDKSLDSGKVFNLSEKQEKAIEYLSTGKYTKREIAKELGVTPKTLWYWGKGEEFQAALKAAEDDQKRRTLAFINSKAYDAAVELWQICLSSKDHRTKEKALAAWLDRALGKPAQVTNVTVDDKSKTQDDFDIEAALAELKEQIDNNDNGYVSPLKLAQ